LEPEKKQKLKLQLSAYLPSGFEDTVVDLLEAYPVRFHITNPRSSKLGDYRPPMNNKSSHRISINGNLNPYHFLVTTLHEFAHLITHINYGHRVKPHGEEWKHEFRKLLWPAIQSNLLPKDIENALMVSLANTKASSCSDLQLFRALKKFDTQQDSLTTLEEVPKNATFVLQGRTFVKGELRRTRYLCTEDRTNRKYLIHALATIDQYESTEK
jgi:hypothetical protein